MVPKKARSNCLYFLHWLARGDILAMALWPQPGLAACNAWCLQRYDAKFYSRVLALLPRLLHMGYKFFIVHILEYSQKIADSFMTGPIKFVTSGSYTGGGLCVILVHSSYICSRAQGIALSHHIIPTYIYFPCWLPILLSMQQCQNVGGTDMAMLQIPSWSDHASLISSV